MITRVTQEYPARKVTLLRILDVGFVLKAIVEMEFNVGLCHVSKILRDQTLNEKITQKCSQNEPKFQASRFLAPQPFPNPFLHCFGTASGRLWDRFGALWMSISTEVWCPFYDSHMSGTCTYVRAVLCLVNGVCSYVCGGIDWSVGC